MQANTTVFPASPTIDKAQFVKRVNKICREGWVTIFDNWNVYSSTQDPTLSEKERFIDAARLSLMAGIEFHIFDEIFRLGGPTGEEREVEVMIGTLQSAIERAQKGLAPIDSVAQVTELFDDYNQLARQDGLDECLVDEARLQRLET